MFEQNHKMRTKRHVVYRTETRQDRQDATRRTKTERRRRDKQKRRERQQTAWRLQKRFDKENNIETIENLS